MSKSQKNALISQVQATPALVENVNNQALTDTKAVAYVFGKELRNVNRDVRELKSKIEGVCSNLSTPPAAENSYLFQETTYVNEQNHQEYPMYILNKNSLMLLISGYQSDKALQFRMAFINAFAKMESEIAEAKAKRAAELATIKANKANPIWLPARVNSISDFHNLADVIKNELIPLAKLQGSNNPDKLYQVYLRNYRRRPH